MAKKSPSLSQVLDTLNTALERAIDSVDAALALCDASNARIDALNNLESTRTARSGPCTPRSSCHRSDRIRPQGSRLLSLICSWGRNVGGSSRRFSS